MPAATSGFADGKVGLRQGRRHLRIGRIDSLGIERMKHRQGSVLAQRQQGGGDLKLEIAGSGVQNRSERGIGGFGPVLRTPAVWPWPADSAARRTARPSEGGIEGRRSGFKILGPHPDELRQFGVGVGVAGPPFDGFSQGGVGLVRAIKPHQRSALDQPGLRRIQACREKACWQAASLFGKPVGVSQRAGKIVRIELPRWVRRRRRRGGPRPHHPFAPERRALHRRR